MTTSEHFSSTRNKQWSHKTVHGVAHHCNNFQNTLVTHGINSGARRQSTLFPATVTTFRTLAEGRHAMLPTWVLRAVTWCYRIECWGVVRYYSLECWGMLCDIIDLNVEVCHTLLLTWVLRYVIRCYWLECWGKSCGVTSLSIEVTQCCWSVLRNVTRCYWSVLRNVTRCYWPALRNVTRCDWPVCWEMSDDVTDLRVEKSNTMLLTCMLKYVTRCYWPAC